MGLNRPTQAHLRSDITDFDPSQSFLELAFFDSDGNALDLTPGGSFTPAANVAAITTPDGSDAGTTQTLANANKAKINALIQALIDAGLMAAS